MSLREALAAYAHEAWSGWMEYMFDKCQITKKTQESVYIRMPITSFDRWQRQMNTPYSELPEDEKESDRKEADKIIEIIYVDYSNDAELIALNEEVFVLRELLKDALGGEKFLEKAISDKFKEIENKEEQK